MNAPTKTHSDIELRQPRRSRIHDRSDRPRRFSLVRWLLLTCMLAAAGQAFAANPMSVDIAVKSLKVAQPPRLVEDVLLFSYKPDGEAMGAVGLVGARFAHESWKVLHLFSRNENGVFALDYPVPEGLREFRYRIVVDGLWMSDPANPNVDTDTLGNAVSVYQLEKEPARALVNPKRERDGAITFTFRGASGRRVSVAGDFNNWDPFIDLLAETAPGTYTLTLRVPAGAHWYVFFYNGRRFLDSWNPQTGADPEGATVSYFLLSS
jgi:1,4-alpha-glucan branching enzyme